MDIYANVIAESTGRLLVTRLWEMTDDQGMKDMLAYLIARDTMHQNQWLKVLQTMDNSEDHFDHLPVPDSFADEDGNEAFDDAFIGTDVESKPDPETPWTQGESIDGEGVFTYIKERDMEGAVRNVPQAPPEVHNIVAEIGEDAKTE